MLSALARRVARRAGGEAVALINNAAAAAAAPSSAAEIANAAASSSSSSLLLLRSCFSSSALASTSSGASSSFSAAALSCAGAAQSKSWLRHYSAAFFADLTLPSSAPAKPNPVGAASHLKAALKPRQGRNRFARAWRRASETQADAKRRKHETSVALAVRDARRRRRWAAAGSVARGADGEIL